MFERIRISTEDGLQLAGVFVAARAPLHRAVLLLHMMPATKESYTAFQETLAGAGFASLAIDFRGHGESDGGPDGYRRFSDAEQQKKMLDVEAATRWLEQKGVSGRDLVIVGASIGANLALEYAAAHPDVPAVVALSPGLDYRGVLTMPAVQGLGRRQRLYLAASRDDAKSDAAIDKLAEVSLAKTQVRHFDRAGHGTSMFEREPGFMDELVAWIQSS